MKTMSPTRTPSAADEGAGSNDRSPLRGAEQVLAPVRRVPTLWGGSWGHVLGSAFLSRRSRVATHAQTPQGKAKAMNVGGYVALTIYVSAAFAEGNGDQRRLLHTKLPPMIKRMRAEAHDDEQWRLALQSLLIRIQEVMGVGWMPRGEIGEYIRRLISESIQEREAKKVDVGKQAPSG